MTEDEATPTRPDTAPTHAAVKARTVLRLPIVWIFPLAIPVVVIALVTTIYIGSVINPVGHLHGLPVRVVDEDAGATTSSGHVDLGQSVVHALQSSQGVTSRLDLEITTLGRAEADMNDGDAYATLVIPSTFTASALLDAGYPVRSVRSATSTPATPAVQLLENDRLGSLGVSLAAGVLTPAIGDISTQLGAKLSAQATTTVRSDPELAAQVADPVTLTTSSYRPLPSHSALGLSAFYVSLIAILSGFLGGTLVNSSIDGALGYAATDIGPRWTMRLPLAISRRQTLFTKWLVALVASPCLAAVVVAVAVGAFGMDAPDFGLLWLLLTLATLMVATGTLALLAAFGSLGQLLAMVVIVYLSLASSGGTIPVQALPGFFRAVSAVEPLRQLLGGVRDILYFGAQWQAGIAHAVLVLGIELGFWLVVGLAFTSWYDHRKLDRLSPEIIDYIHGVVTQRRQA